MTPRALALFLGTLLPISLVADDALLRGTVLDANSGMPIPARVYVESEAGNWLFVESASSEGSALPYDEQWVPIAGSVEKHTTVSAHPFRIQLKPGRYTITIERGKEYLPHSETIEMDAKALEKTFRLQRWVNLAERGWYSGETHVHRRIHELPNVMLAEDLNVAFPVTFWTTNAFASPNLHPSTLRRQGPSPFGNRQDKGADKIEIDPNHVIYPRNTEYEVFSVNGKPHTLGALFILNHQTVFKDGMPPVAAIAKQAHAEGALLDLDKHSWPWSMMLVPVARVDLFELSNNSVWRTKFGFRNASVQPAPYMNVERDAQGMTEWGWLNFGFETYYALLNCGFRLKPTAGTASGVHPVPLGHSRVYVHTGETFDSERWLAGLKQGKSFVTTGPMLFATLDETHPGHVFASPDDASFDLEIESVSARPVGLIEVIVNGEVWRSFQSGTDFNAVENGRNGWRVRVNENLAVDTSSWVAIRSVQQMPDGRKRFAHTSPWHIDIADKPLVPRKQQTDYLIHQVKGELDRNRDALPADALEEFNQALQIYEALGKKARP